MKISQNFVAFSEYMNFTSNFFGPSYFETALVHCNFTVLVYTLVYFDPKELHFKAKIDNFLTSNFVFVLSINIWKNSLKKGNFNKIAEILSAAMTT